MVFVVLLLNVELVVRILRVVQVTVTVVLQVFVPQMQNAMRLVQLIQIVIPLPVIARTVLPASVR